MKIGSIALSAVVSGALICATMDAHAARYIVLYKQHAVPADASAKAKAIGGRLVASFGQLGIAVAESDKPDFAVQMASDVRIQSIGADLPFGLPELQSFTLPDAGPTAADELYSEGLLWGIERIHAPDVWAAGVTGSKKTTVAVIDTGIATNHPDLAPNVVFTACYASTPGCNPYPSLSDHGTHVAGTIAAAFGGGLAVGVGPDLGLASYNTFEAIPGCGTCSYTSSRWSAMLDAAKQGFKVINMSLGSLGAYGGKGTNDLATFVAADNRVANDVIKAGTTIVASGGNSALDLNGVYINIPGGLPGVVNVSAAGIQPQPRYQPGASYDVLAFYSNYGASIDISAPGGDCGQIGQCAAATRPANWFEYLILSTTVTPNVDCAATKDCAVGYGWKGGTSMAAPHVSGVVGLVRDTHPNMSASQAAQFVLRNAERIGDRQSFGHGMADARTALQ